MLASERERGVAIIGVAIVVPGVVVVDGVVVIVAVGARCRVAAGAPYQRDRGAVDRYEHHSTVADDWLQVLDGAEAEAVGQLDANRTHAGLLERARQPRRVGALGQPQASAPALAEAASVGADPGLHL